MLIIHQNFNVKEVNRMKETYIAPEVMAINMEDLTVLLRCACTADDTNPWR